MRTPISFACCLAVAGAGKSAFAAKPRASAHGAKHGASPSPALNDADALRHDELVRQGSDLIRPYMRLTDIAPKKSDGASKDLREGIRLLDEAIKLSPTNWSALWVQGKAFQSLDEHHQAYARFKRSYALAPDNPDVGRELMLECLEVGRASEAVDVARAAAPKAPGDAGLRANLALALLLAGRLDQASAGATAALQMEPQDAITKDVLRVIDEVRRGKRPKPRHISDISKR